MTIGDLLIEPPWTQYSEKPKKSTIQNFTDIGKVVSICVNEDRFSSKLLGHFCGRIYCKVKPLKKCQEIGQNVNKIPNSICISHIIQSIA